MTHVAAIPPGSHRDISDPYAEKKSPWPKLLFICVLLYLAFTALNHFGYIDFWAGGLIGTKRDSLPHNIIIEKHFTSNAAKTQEDPPQ